MSTEVEFYVFSIFPFCFFFTQAFKMVKSGKFSWKDFMKFFFFQKSPSFTPFQTNLGYFSFGATHLKTMEKAFSLFKYKERRFRYFRRKNVWFKGDLAVISSTFYKYCYLPHSLPYSWHYVSLCMFVCKGKTH